jgi:hypothetical protein
MTIDDAIKEYEHIAELYEGMSDYEEAANKTQIVEWLRKARGADEAAQRFTEKIYELEDENAELRALTETMLHDAMENICAKAYWCDKKNWRTCNDRSCGNHLYIEVARKLGIEVR